MFWFNHILLRSTDSRHQVPKLSEIRPKFRCFLDRQIFGERGSKFLTKFYKSGSPSSMWQSFMTIDRSTEEIRGDKKTKEVLNDSSKMEWPDRPAELTGGHKRRELCVKTHIITTVKLKTCNETGGVQAALAARCKLQQNANEFCNNCASLAGLFACFTVAVIVFSCKF